MSDPSSPDTSQPARPSATRWTQIIDDNGTELLDAHHANQLASHFVGYLAESGIEPGSRIIFQANNSVQLAAAVLGCLLSGFVPVVISNKLTQRERDELTEDVAPALFVDDEILANAFNAPQIALGDHWRCRPMHFTSGTSGRPKGVWSGWLDDEASSALLAEEIDAWSMSPSDCHLVVAPMSHSAPLRFPLMTLMAGGSIVVPSAFDPEVISALIDSGQVTTTFMAPTHLQRLLEVAPPRQPRMRLVAHAGSACPEHVRRLARATFGDDVLREFYGSTEGQFTICTPKEFDAYPGTVGRARPGRTLRVDDDGHIWCQVPPHARFEYWGDPNKTAQAWSEDWFTVGDLGELDADGYLYLNGRRSDLIISGGVNVYPAEIERVVLDHPDVSQAIAFGVDDDHWGQRVCLAVVTSAPQEVLADYCRAQLAPYKRPKDIYLVPELPLTHNGKISRHQVLEFIGERSREC